MPISSIPTVLATLRRYHLLGTPQLQELTCQLEAQLSSVPSSDGFRPEGPAEEDVLFQQLVERGWLTSYQMTRLLEDGDGLVLGPYILLDRLGEGATGEVFKARHRRFDRFCALKVMRPDCLGDAEAVARFWREAEALSRLNHPNILSIHDANEDRGLVYLATEYIEGVTLKQLRETTGSVSIVQTCSYIRQAALGLQHLHECGMVHRDVKPSNLLLDRAKDRIKLFDMGLVRSALSAGLDSLDGELTRPGAVVGTPDYLAPEQALNARQADIRSDLYSLGCSLYFLLTGQPPFPDGSVFQKLLHHQFDQPEPIDRLCPDAPSELIALVRRMMAKHPDDRPQTPVEVVEALSAFTVTASAGEPAASPAPRLREGEMNSRTLTSFTATLPEIPVFHCIAPRPAADDLVNAIGMKFALIPAGVFSMGSPSDEAGRRADEFQHEVTLSRVFHLGIYPVTQEQYQTVMDANPSFYTAARGGSGEHPVENVSWPDAVAFCRRLSELPAEKQAGRSYRLPTEAEWEYACRAGSAEPFHHGAAISSKQANLCGHFPYGGAPRGPSVGRTARVGRYPANAFGLYDMHGNVKEWCADWYGADAYRENAQQDPQGPSAGSERVVRGGSWANQAVDCRSASRGKLAPALHHGTTGFRIVCIPSDASI